MTPTWFDVIVPQRAQAWPKPAPKPRTAGSGWRQVLRGAFVELGLDAADTKRYLDVIARHAASCTLYVSRLDRDALDERNRLIRAQVREGMTRRAVAKIHRISASQVQRIVRVPPSAGKGVRGPVPCGAPTTPETAHENRRIDLACRTARP